ncbi:MAG: NAD-binding protein [candidate division NC10 bacterium]
MDTIGFIGLGRMGAPMAGRLLDRGHRLVVHMVKDLDGYTRLARETGVPSLLGTAAAEVFRIALARGMGDLDHTAVVRLIEEWTGTELRSRTGGQR